MTRHRWGDGIQFPNAHKTERTCLNDCGITKVHRYESEGGHDTHWTEFYRDGVRIEGEGTPPCDRAVKKRPTYDLGHYPL